MFIRIFKELIKKISLARALIHLELEQYTLSGSVLDIGGGKKRPEYLNFFQSNSNYEWNNIDLKTKANFNLEVDKLPYDNESFDQVLNFNLLEHIYNYKFVMRESFRVLKIGGEVIGFVPFFVNYHPDPHDYFRYTKEALKKIFTESGFSEIYIKEIGGSSFLVNYNNIVLSVPLFVRLVLFPVYYFLNYIFIKLRPKIGDRYPLGYFFVLKKIKI